MKFAITKNHFVDNKSINLVLLVDFKFWAQNENELKIWCEHNNCIHKGMVVLIPNDIILSLFILRWT